MLLAMTSPGTFYSVLLAMMLPGFFIRPQRISGYKRQAKNIIITYASLSRPSSSLVERGARGERADYKDND
jgi:hypothetical protein